MMPVEPTIDIIIEEPTLIIDGYVTITIGSGSGSLTVKAKVKQVKGRGVHDAEKLLVANEDHLETLAFLIKINSLSNVPFTSKEIYENLNHQRKLRFLAGEGKYIEIPRPTHTRTMSEFLYKKIITVCDPAVRVDARDKKGPTYLLDMDKARKVVETGRFEL